MRMSGSHIPYKSAEQIRTSQGQDTAVIKLSGYSEIHLRVWFHMPGSPEITYSNKCRKRNRKFIRKIERMRHINGVLVSPCPFSILRLCTHIIFQVKFQIGMNIPPITYLYWNRQIGPEKLKVSQIFCTQNLVLIRRIFSVLPIRHFIFNVPITY